MSAGQRRALKWEVFECVFHTSFCQEGRDCNQCLLSYRVLLPNLTDGERRDYAALETPPEVAGDNIVKCLSKFGEDIPWALRKFEREFIKDN